MTHCAYDESTIRVLAAVKNSALYAVFLIMFS